MAGKALAAPGSDEPTEQALASLARVVARRFIPDAAWGTGPGGAGRRAGLGDEFLDHRPYVPGDDARSVNWRLSARLDHPQVRRYRATSGQEWHVALDASASMASHGPGTWHFARHVAQACAYVLLHLGLKTGLVAFAGDVRLRVDAGRGPRQFLTVLRDLERLEPAQAGTGTRPARCAEHLPPRCRLLVISDLQHESALSGLVELGASGRPVRCLRVTAPAPSIPTDGRVLRLVDSETGAWRDVAADAESRQGAAAALARWETGVEARCRSAGITLTGAAPDDGWRQAVLHHFARSGCRGR